MTISLPPATSLDKTKDVERQVRAILNSYPEVHNVATHGRPDEARSERTEQPEIMADPNPRDTWHFDKETMMDMTRKTRAIPVCQPIFPK